MSDIQKDMQNDAATKRLTPKELSVMAYKGIKPTQALTGYEWLYWYTCRDIYADLRSGACDEETCQERKAAANVQYDKTKRETEELSDGIRRVAALWKNIEQAATEYHKARNDGERIDAADKMMNVVYGLLGG